MKRFLFAVAVLAFCSANADAGPIRCIAANVKQLVEARVEQVKERIQARPIVRQVRTDVTTVANSRPVARIVYGVAQVAAVRANTCPGGVCPK